MGVAPLPHFKTLYLHFDEGKVKIPTADLPSYREFGRLHFTKAEILELEKKEKEEIKMAFKTIDPTTLPVTVVGRVATEPIIGISGSGQVVFNSFIQKAWVGERAPEEQKDRLVIQIDPETNRMAFIGVTKGKMVKGVANYFPITVSKPHKDKKTGKLVGGGDLSTPATSLLKNEMKYDYKAAGPQIYKAEFNEKMSAYIITLPKETPKPRPVQVRKKKVVNVAPATNGTPTVPVNVAPPAEDEIMIVE